MPVKLSSTGGGSVTLTTPSTASDFTATFPAATGNVVTTGSSAVVTQAMLGTNVAGNGPAFGAYRSSNQTISGSTYTKIQLNLEEFDTNNNFDSTTNYRFTPTVAGYYQINGGAALSASTMTVVIVGIFKNGSEFKRGVDVRASQSEGSCVVSSLIYMNGSTDYLELYAYITASSGTPTILGSSHVITYLNGFLARTA